MAAKRHIEFISLISKRVHIRVIYDYSILIASLCISHVTFIKQMFYLFFCVDIGLPKPDLLFFLDTRNIDLANREEFGTERNETSEFQSKVYSNFKRLLNYENPENYCHIINAKNSIENIHAEILAVALDLLKSDNLLSDPTVLW